METLPSVIHPSWQPFLIQSFQSEDVCRLKYDILPKQNFHPHSDNIFRVFSMPLQDIKVVILGQDPYPDVNQAIGYAFAVSEQTAKPFSLRAIEKEVGHELDKTLSSWIEQGVFLLNTSLTVQHRKPGSHSPYWHSFTTNVIRTISTAINPIWMLWGLNAVKFERTIRAFSLYNYDNILKAPHPAAESYARGHAGFYGCNHFVKANLLLTQNKKTIINW